MLSLSDRPGHVDLDEFRQVLRQARDLDLGAHVRDDAALRLDARRDRRALEVQGNADADLLVLLDALKIDVHDRVLERMTLHVLQDGGLRLIAHLQVEDGRIEALVVEHDHELLMAQGQGARLRDARHKELPALFLRDAGGGSHLCLASRGTRQRVQKRFS